MTITSPTDDCIHIGRTPKGQLIPLRPGFASASPFIVRSYSPGELALEEHHKAIESAESIDYFEIFESSGSHGEFEETTILQVAGTEYWHLLKDTGKYSIYRGPLGSKCRIIKRTIFRTTIAPDDWEHVSDWLGSWSGRSHHFNEIVVPYGLVVDCPSSALNLCPRQLHHGVFLFPRRIGWKFGMPRPS